MTTKMFGTTSTTQVLFEGKHKSCHRITKVMLSVFTVVYSITNLAVFILSTMAWRNVQAAASRSWHACTSSPELCSPGRGVMYAFISAVSLISFLTTGLMAARMVFHQRKNRVDAPWVFRGVFFTLLLFIPLIYIGWSEPLQTHDKNNSVNMAGLAPLFHLDHNEKNKTGTGVDMSFIPDINFGPSKKFTGIVGAFVVESAVSGVKMVKATVVMVHVNA